MTTQIIDSGIAKLHHIATHQLPQKGLSKLLGVGKGKVQAIITDSSGENTVSLDVSRGLLRSGDDFLRVDGYSGMGELEDIEVVLDPSKLQYIHQGNGFVIMKDDKFVYLVRDMDHGIADSRPQVFIKIISSSSNTFREIGSNKHGIFHTDGVSTFFNGRPQSYGEVKNIEGYSRDENYLYRDGFVVFTKDSGLDISTVQQLSEHYFTDKSGKVIYLDPYRRSNDYQKPFYVLAEGVVIQNFRWVPEADNDKMKYPSYTSLHTDGKRDYITGFVVQYVSDEKTGALNRSCDTIHHGTLKTLVPILDIPRLIESKIITQEMADRYLKTG